MDVEDPSHAFYLGYELMKATTALTLSKSYRQDQALQWGFLTRPEASHRERERPAANGGGRRMIRLRSPTIRAGGQCDPRRDRHHPQRRRCVERRPDGPRVDSADSMERFVLRPYRTSTTYQNLKARGEGVLHVTDDVLLLAQAAIGASLDPVPATRRRAGCRGGPVRCLPLL